VINTARARGAKIVLMENYYDRRSSDQIATHSGAKVVSVPSMVGGTDKVQTYFDLFDAIVAGLVGATRG
jgi:ABC-type Zn uptake system ZnuABC Zn-binding protein ZnuA